MKKSYSDYEGAGRKKMLHLFKRQGITDFEFTDGQYDNWDASYTAGTDTANVEIKNRDIPFDKYASEGYMIEQIKWNALMEAKERTGSEPLFFIFFQNGQGIWFNLSELDPKREWKEMWCTKSTANDTYGKVKELKTFTLVFPNDGHRFTYDE